MSEFCVYTQLEIYGSTIGVPEFVFCDPYAETINFHSCIKKQPNKVIYTLVNGCFNALGVVFHCDIEEVCSAKNLFADFGLVSFLA